MFDAIRHLFATTLQNMMKTTVQKNKLEDVEEYLGVVYLDLEVAMKTVHSYWDLISPIQCNCLFTNICMLESLNETIAKDILKVWELPTKFKEARKKIYGHVLAKHKE